MFNQPGEDYKISILHQRERERENDISTLSSAIEDTTHTHTHTDPIEVISQQNRIKRLRENPPTPNANCLSYDRS